MQKYIESLLEQWKRTENGKKQIAEFLKTKALKVAEAVRKELFTHIREVIPSFLVDDIIIDSTLLETPDGFEMYLSLDMEGVHRESLYPLKYSGIDNIVLLFVKGHDVTKNRAYGVWRDRNDKIVNEKTAGVRYREPNDFLERAVKAINESLEKGIKVELMDEYKNN